ncbi:uncharacterized protein DFL_004561 [Arthrobotrys flagrans]|uniref:F-box domain-containing protein n=1 Tax=Arthrobotrys flagrans TaxID=97331 RepID=A0A437A5F9_ARTFL|nr:hypothetical protein DFL_004561 [Arthrobotrys flagrans]
MSSYRSRRRPAPRDKVNSLGLFPTEDVKPGTPRTLSQLERLPTDIAYIVVKNLAKRDLGNFARCSSVCHDFTLLLRLRRIILTSDGIRAFRDGGKYEMYRKYVRCARFVNPSGWDPDPVWNEGEGNRTYRDPTVPALRTYTQSLDYFSDITELHITYKIPAAAEGNAFVAVYASISKQPFYQQLRKLEFVVEKTQETAYYWTQADLNPEYLRLEKEDQEFLGDRILKEEDVDTTIKRLVVPAPSLRSAMISVTGIARPWEALRTGEGRGLFYYYPFFQAPKLVELIVNVKGDGGPQGPRSSSRCSLDITQLKELGNQVLGRQKS